jgi:hypothetical protein
MTLYCGERYLLVKNIILLPFGANLNAPRDYPFFSNLAIICKYFEKYPTEGCRNDIV